MANYNKLIQLYLDKHHYEFTKDTFFSESDNQISKIASFINNKIKKILFTHFTRSSFNDTEGAPFLYDLSFEDPIPKIHLYRFEDNLLKLLFITNMTPIKDGFECFQDTPLKITLELHQGAYQTIFRIRDKRNEIIYAQSSTKIDLGIPDLKEYLELSRYENFNLTEDIKNETSPNHLFYARAKKNEKENRLIAFTMLVSEKKIALIEDLNFEKSLNGVLTDIESSNPVIEHKAYFNRIIFKVIPELISPENEILQYLEHVIDQHRKEFRRLRIEKIIFKYKKMVEFKNLLDSRLSTEFIRLDAINREKRVSTANNVEQREIQVMSKGQIWAYRIPSLIDSIVDELREKTLGIKKPPLAQTFVELDIDHSQTVIQSSTGSIDYNFGELIAVSRPVGHNEAGVIVGIITDDLGINIPIKRIIIIGDLSHSSRGAIRGQECIRINAAIRYAAKEKIPIDWYAASFGVQIHRERGVEGLDAAASTVREIINNCQHKGVEINLIINDANIGAQSYWDSLATIIYDTPGILIMTPNGSMALTGPKSLACALYGTVHSEQIDQFTKSLYPEGLQSLSGHSLVHGPNSDSMILANSLEDATKYLMLHHYYSYLKPGEKVASQRRIPQDKILTEEEKEAVFKEISGFVKGTKPNRKVILDYLRDENSPVPLQFWSDAKGIVKQTFANGDLPQEASTIVQEILIGGNPTLVIFTPTGPLTPADSDIIARAIYKASGRMQVLIIGSLSGFSCDPLSMKNRQLLEGALIAKSIVEHKGPILVVNLGSLVGGTFVVFNKQLQQDLRILAIEGARVQVIGGKSAAKVVFHSLICKQADQDERVLKSSMTHGEIGEDQKIQKIFKEARSNVIIEIENKEGVLFDQFHSAQRALKIKSIDQIVSIPNLRNSIIQNFEEIRVAYLKRP